MSVTGGLPSLRSIRQNSPEVSQLGSPFLSNRLSDKESTENLSLFGFHAPDEVQEEEKLTRNCSDFFSLWWRNTVGSASNIFSSNTEVKVEVHNLAWDHENLKHSEDCSIASRKRYTKSDSQVGNHRKFYSHCDQRPSCYFELFFIPFAPVFALLKTITDWLSRKKDPRLEETINNIHNFDASLNYADDGNFDDLITFVANNIFKNETNESSGFKSDSSNLLFLKLKREDKNEKTKKLIVEENFLKHNPTLSLNPVEQDIPSPSIREKNNAITQLSIAKLQAQKELILNYLKDRRNIGKKMQNVICETVSEYINLSDEDLKYCHYFSFSEYRRA